LSLRGQSWCLTWRANKTSPARQELTGLYVLKHQPANFAAIEARWKTQQPASEVLIAIPDEARERNLFAIEIPKLGSFIASGNWTAREIGLDAFPPQDRPPVLIPFFGFRIMVGVGLIMLAVSWFGTFLRFRGRLEGAGLSGEPSSPFRPASLPS
jgi:cytochrome bd ubiquinol oxidase subunit I